MTIEPDQEIPGPPNRDPDSRSRPNRETGIPSPFPGKKTGNRGIQFPKSAFQVFKATSQWWVTGSELMGALREPGAVHGLIYHQDPSLTIRDSRMKVVGTLRLHCGPLSRTLRLAAGGVTTEADAGKCPAAMPKVGRWGTTVTLGSYWYLGT